MLNKKNITVLSITFVMILIVLLLSRSKLLLTFKNEEPQVVHNPYKSINNNVQYDDGKISSPVLPYGDFFSLFTKLPLGHTKATGKGISIGVIGKSDYASFIYFAARDSKVLRFNELSVDKLKQNDVRIAAIPDFKEFDSEELKAFVKSCIGKNISVVVEGDIAQTKDEIKLLNDIEKVGAITVGRVDMQGVTYQQTKNSTDAFNLSLRDLNINIFTCPAYNSFYELDYRNCLYGVTGALAMVLEIKDMDANSLKEYLLSHSRNVWQMSNITGTEIYYKLFSINGITSQYIPKKDSQLYFYRQLDFQYLLDVQMKSPWNSNIFNLTKAWDLSKGNVDVAVIDSGFHPEAPLIKNNIVDKKEFGYVVWGGEFHGTSMCKALLSIAPKAKLHLLLTDVIDDGGRITTDNLVKAIDYCIENKIPVVSTSLSGSFSSDKKLTSKIKEAKDAGITFVWFHYPDSVKGIIRPSMPDVGRDKIVALDRFIEDDMFYPQEIQAGLSNTAPQVAGLVALIKEKSPDLSPEQIEDLLYKNSYKLDSISGYMYIPDMYKLLSGL